MQKQENCKYSESFEAHRRACNSEKPVLDKILSKVVPKNLIAKLNSIYKEYGRGELQRYVAEHVRCLVSLCHAQVWKKKGTRIENLAVPTLLSKWDPRSSKNVKISGKIVVNLNQPDEDVELIVHYNGKDLFAIKQSTLPDSQLGLFSLQEFDEGDCLGFYCGRLMTGLKYPLNKYAITTGTQPCKIYQASREEMWMGLHFANNPYFDKYAKKEKVDGKSDVYNILINKDLRVSAKCQIKIGEELFLFYNL
ncbi:hypothetical protein ACA910_014345 [Epithemia clementina (nom. ined.)]